MQALVERCPRYLPRRGKTVLDATIGEVPITKDREGLLIGFPGMDCNRKLPFARELKL